MENTGNSFYDSIMNDAQSLMEKEASVDSSSIEKILSESDMSESELSKLASELDSMLDEEDIDDDIENGNEPTPDDEAEDDGEGEGEDELESEAGELDEEDFAKLAEYYDDVQEKYASEGLGVADYAYDQLGNPDDAMAIKLATIVGEQAEKLAYVTEISPYAVADDLLMAIANKMDIEDADEE